MESVAARTKRKYRELNMIPLYHPYTSDGRIMWFRRTQLGLDLSPEQIAESRARRVAEYGFCTSEIRALMEHAVAQGFTLILSSSYEDGRPPEHNIIGVKPRPRGPESDRLTLSLVLQQSGPLTVDQATDQLEYLWRM